MIGLLVWKRPEKGKRQKRVTSEVCSILQMRVLKIEILRGEKTTDAVLRRRVAAAARIFGRSGVTEIIPPTEFMYLPPLEKAGVCACSRLPLARALAVRLVQRCVKQLGESPGTVRVAVCGESLTGELVRVVRELALRYRYVLLAVPSGGEELAHQLRREYGVSLLVTPGKAQPEAANVTVLFSPAKGKGSGVVVPLYEGAEVNFPDLRLPPVLEEQLPADVERTALLAALYRCGAIRAEQIHMET